LLWPPRKARRRVRRSLQAGGRPLARRALVRRNRNGHHLHRDRRRAGPHFRVLPDVDAGKDARPLRRRHRQPHRPSARRDDPQGPLRRSLFRRPPERRRAHRHLPHPPGPPRPRPREVPARSTDRVHYRLDRRRDRAVCRLRDHTHAPGRSRAYQHRSRPHRCQNRPPLAHHARADQSYSRLGLRTRCEGIEVAMSFMNPAEFANIRKSEERFWWYRGMRAILFRFLEPHLKGRTISRALEAGCGTGYLSHLIQRERGWPIVPLDYSWDGLRYASEIGVERVAQGDARDLPFADGTFDLTFSIVVLAHIPPGDEGRAARELARVTKRGGLVVVRTSAFQFLRSHHSEFVGERQRFHRRALMELSTGAGFP